MNAPEALNELVAAVQQAARYRTLDPGLVRWIGAQELNKRRNIKEAIKATRSRLHQVAGAYLPAGLDCQRWIEALEGVGRSLNEPELQALCRQWMAHHASTRERLPLLSSFYVRVLTPLAPVRSLLDLACGLNPLALPWMPLAPDAPYYACDIYTDLVDFLNRFMEHTGRRGGASVCDLTRPLHHPPVQVALLLKALPCLEQLDKRLPERLLDSICAEVVVVSFPARSLRGRSKGMVENYGDRFERLAAARNWSVERVEFATELVFIIHR
ncbi:MAG: hypothetical protein U1B80_09915 [Anaerolineaceae bacterium]|nr:hypothetical protein [Anaerolineaceae bacterium]